MIGTGLYQKLTSIDPVTSNDKQWSVMASANSIVVSFQGLPDFGGNFFTTYCLRTAMQMFCPVQRCQREACQHETKRGCFKLELIGGLRLTLCVHKHTGSRVPGHCSGCRKPGRRSFSFLRANRARETRDNHTGRS